MDSAFWKMVWFNLITPTVPFPTFLYRAESTVTATTTTPWWIVLIIANVVGALGQLHLVMIYRRYTSRAVDRWRARSRTLDWLWRHLSRSMFGLQIALNFTFLPDHLSCLLAGSVKYPLRRFFFAQCIGRTAHNLPLVLGGLWVIKQPWYHRLSEAFYHPAVVATFVGILSILIIRTTVINVLERGLSMFFGEDDPDDDEADYSV